MKLSLVKSFEEFPWNRFAEYQTSKMIEDLKSELPSIDDLERTVKDLATSDGKHLVTSDGFQLTVSPDSDDAANS